MEAPGGPWVLSLGLGFAALLVVWTAPETPRRLARGSVAPDFELPGLDGRLASLEDTAGRLRLVNFWATWCKPCEDEMPSMQKLYSEFADEGFDLIAISVDEDLEAVRRFQERYQLSFPILLDSEQEVSERYQTYRFPESFLIDPAGEVVERYVGPKRWDDEAYLERVRRLLPDDRGLRVALPEMASEGAAN